MRKLSAACLVGLAAGALVLRAASPSSGLIVHEWGTFLAMNGSDGVTLDGMYHEEHALPGFVHARGRDELRLPTSNIKGETPVIYFYSDTPVRASVQVKFPSGIWTQWYPQARLLGPSLVQTGSLLHPQKGWISWDVDVVPPTQAHGALPVTQKDALWNYTRDVDAAFLHPAAFPNPTASRVNDPDEWERFIFYRGLGEAKLPLNVSTDGAVLSCDKTLKQPLRHVYLLRVENGQGVYRYVPSLRCGDRIDQVVPALAGAKPVETFASLLADDLAARLVESGLYAKEARAMVNTWRTSYFATDGIRVLFVLPQEWTNTFIPMEITPKPDQLVRVMVGRIELLTPDRERAAQTAIANLASPNSQVREAAFATLQQQGRYVEPIVRRTMESSADERVRTLCRRLLLTDFVTEIRTSLTNAADGRPLMQEPVYARAQLASLLRDVGLTEEARQEGELALKALATMPQPTMTNHESRNTFRALARANEGAGHDAAALKWYNDFIEFGTGYRTCSGCHATAGPTSDDFFRDWAVGKRFADLAWRTGDAPQMIKSNEAKLAEAPKDFLARVRLAYLYEGRGDTQAAARVWSGMEQRPAVRAGF
jgi:hypothetical protein